MVWTLLTLLSSATLLASSVSAAKHSGASGGRFAVVVGLGLVLAALNLVALELMVSAIEGRIKSYPDAAQERIFGIIYIGAGLWIVGAGLVGFWCARAALHLIRG